jgi:hypothetical protein
LDTLEVAAAGAMLQPMPMLVERLQMGVAMAVEQLQQVALLLDR